MNLEKHVLLSLEAYARGNKEEALMHAAISIEGTAKKLFKKGGRKYYKKCLREYWWLIERFIGEGLNLEETKFSHLKLVDDRRDSINEPDLADVIYHIFRCKHAHAEPIPLHYELLDSTTGQSHWVIDKENNGLRMPDKLIFALLAISVFCKVNADIKTDGAHYLSWGTNESNKLFIIKDYWGKEDEVRLFFSEKPQSRIKLDFTNWLS